VSIEIDASPQDQLDEKESEVIFESAAKFHKVFKGK
jgi:hypothetical protein